MHSTPSYTKFTLARGKFKKIEAFASFKNEIWCMGLPNVNKLAKDNNGVKHRQDLFNRTVDAKGMKTKDSQELIPAFWTMIKNKNRPKKI